MIKRVRIVHDPDAESPRENDNLGTMVCWHRRYTLGDVQPKISPLEYQEQEVPKGSILLPLYLYDHSGITMSTGPFSCPWDSGQVGFIYISPAKIREEYSVKRITKALRERVTGYLRSEVEEYDRFIQGQTYGFVIEKLVDDEWEHEDSCWGFIGYDPFKNGMSEHVPNELHDLLRKAEPEYR